MTTTNKISSGNGHKPSLQNMQPNMQLLPLIMNNIPQAIFWKDRNLVYLGCNQAFAEDAGFASPEEVIGKTDFDMPWKDQADVYRADDGLVMRNGESKLNYEEPQTTPDGSVIWLRTSKIPVHENGETIAVLGMYEDITVQKRAEKSLQQSEATLSSAMHVAKMGNWEFDLATQMFTLNDQYYSLHGMTAQEAGGYQIGVQRFAQEFVYPEDAAVVGQATQQAIETTDPNFQARTEARIMHADGKPRWVTVWFRIEKDAKGRTIRLHGVNQDITERKQAEKALRESQQLLQTVMDNIPQSIFWKDGNLVYLGCNQAFADDAGLESPNDIRGKTDWDMPWKDQADLYRADDGLVMKNGTAKLNYEEPQTSPAGTTIWLRTSKVPLQDSDGNISAVLGMYEDITERKQAETELRNEKALADAIINGLPGIFYLFDPEGKLIRWNKQYETVLGYTTEEVAATNAIDPIADEDKERTVAAIQRAFVEGQANVEAHLVTRDGHRIPYYFVGQRLQLGDQLYLAGTGIDIAERRRLEAQIQEALARRGLQVQLSTHVSQSIAAASSLEELYDRVVTQVKEQFGYYHTQLLRYDPAQDAVALVTGSGEVGAKMLAAGHRLPMGAGLIGTAAATGETVLRPVLESDPDWQPNPLLPETKGEIAVPIKLGETVLGVLDVQSSSAGALDADDQLLLEGLCGQIAIAIESTRLRQEMSDRLEEINRLYRAMSHEGWQAFRETADLPSSLMYDQGGLRPVEDISLSDELFANIPLTVPGGEVIGTLAVANAPEQPISSDDHAFLEQVAEQVALALESARLFEQTQAALVESEESQKLIRNVIDSTDDWIFVKDRQHRYQLVNQGYAKALHISVEDFIGKTDLELGFPEELVKGNPEKGIRGFWADDALVVESGVPQHFPNDPATIDGQVRIFDTIKVPLRDSSGEIWGVLAFSRDLTERKQAEEIIEQRANQLAAVANVSTTASTLLDPDRLLQSVVDLTREHFGLYHTHIYLADESWQTLLLAAGAGEIGRQMVSDGWNIPMEHESSIVAEAARNRNPIIANNVNHDKESTFLSNRLLPDTRSEMAVPIIVGEKLLGVFDVQSDRMGYFTEEDANIYITLASQIGVTLQNARSYMEQAATLTQLRELDKLKSSFLANMSHELRTPLNSILGFTDVMLEGLDGNLTEHMDNDLRLIQKNGQHLLHLINDVLDMAKIEAGRMNLSPESFKAYEVLEEVASITSTLASEKNLALFLEEDSDPDVRIYADRTRLRQVMINLVNNSIKFTETGKIGIKVVPMEGARILITVKDTGIGIAPDKLDAIFQEFTQVDSSTTRKAGGTGLGLPISRRLVEMHGGRLWAESTGIPGEGSVFSVELPVEARITEVVEKQERAK